MFDSDALKRKRDEAPDLYRLAQEVAFGEDGAVMAAETAAAGSTDLIDDLSDRDRDLLAVGALAGACVAIARSRHPHESPQDALERADIVMQYARSVGGESRNERPLLLPGDQGEWGGS